MNCLSRALLLVLLLLPAAAVADKTDVVVLKNGDKITGEVKRVGGGLLEFSTDTMGRVYIEWRFIAKIFSDTAQSIDTVDGKRYLGKMTALEEGDVIGIQTATELIELPTKDLFSAYPVEGGFLDRSDFDISVGFDYQKSTDIADFVLSADWTHRRPNRITEASLRSNITRQSDGTNQNRNQLQVGHQSLLPDNRYKAWLANVESNESLGLDLRLSAGGVYGNYLIRRSNGSLNVGYGLIGTQESFSDNTHQTGIEGVLSATIKYFRFAEPERSLNSKLMLFPSLTESGRLRSDFRTTFKLEFLKDLFWSMEAYFQSDNEPSRGAEEYDYGITTSIGWSL